jgi:hypothetical protein
MPGMMNMPSVHRMTTINVVGNGMSIGLNFGIHTTTRNRSMLHRRFAMKNLVNPTASRLKDERVRGLIASRLDRLAFGWMATRDR